MAQHYDKQAIKKQILKKIHKYGYVRIAQAYNNAPVSKNTFYNYGLHKDEDILNALEAHREKTKEQLRSQWAEPGANPILQIGLYKLLGDDEEKTALGVQKPAQTNISITVNDIKELSDADLERFVSEGRKKLQSQAKNITPGARTLSLGSGAAA